MTVSWNRWQSAGTDDSLLEQMTVRTDDSRLEQMRVSWNRWGSRLVAGHSLVERERAFLGSVAVHRHRCGSNMTSILHQCDINIYDINITLIWHQYYINITSILHQYHFNITSICHQYDINMPSMCHQYAINMTEIQLSQYFTRLQNESRNHLMWKDLQLQLALPKLGSLA